MPQLAEHDHSLDARFAQPWKAAGGRATPRRQRGSLWLVGDPGHRRDILGVRRAGRDRLPRLAEPLTKATGAPAALIELSDLSKKNPELRGTVRPDPDHILVTADLDQVEL